jgi:hypothetical protein
MRSTVIPKRSRCSRSEPKWIAAEQLIDANVEIVAETGQPFAVLLLSLVLDRTPARR